MASMNLTVDGLVVNPGYAACAATLARQRAYGGCSCQPRLRRLEATACGGCAAACGGCVAACGGKTFKRPYLSQKCQKPETEARMPTEKFPKKSFLVFRVHRCHKWPYLDFVFLGPLLAVTISLLAVTISIWSCKTPPGYTKKAYKHFLLTIPLPNSASNTLKTVLSCRNHRLQSFLNETSRY